MKLDVLNSIGIIGYGEVGKTFATGLKTKLGVTSMAVWDNQFAQENHQNATQGAMRDTAQNVQLAHAASAGVQACASTRALCEVSTFIISAVTASNTLAVAQEAALHIRAGSVFLDLNSASPGTKQQCAALIDAAGAHYVEAGVMTSVPPYGIKVPMLLGGTHAADLSAALNAWGLATQAVSDKVGVASAIKMCRSVMIKGLEALVIESYTTARAYGVEEHMLPTLQETFPSIDWQKQGGYFYSRVVQHGQRRAEEMREAAHTVHEVGFAPTMASAIADKQQWVADLAAQGVFADVAKDARWQDYADSLIAAAKSDRSL
jgi:3-hydroxyisobutyrate dehydrogenase-like beta-hydroxyacid dehydrogenase